jgi:hypothetical protein
VKTSNLTTLKLLAEAEKEALLNIPLKTMA